MPLFKSSRTTPPPQPVEETPARKGSIFHRRSPSNNSTTNSDRTDNSSTRAGSTRSGGFFGMGGNDSITAAKQKVKMAEQHEKAADQALVNARQAVTEAKEHARRLELEAEEDARLAKLKQKEAHGITKSTKTLGRHGP
ncbi:hypothetical protein DL93DRAFT_2081215 [Clavulina sp. PMI_390]|nr:hypothetical protein DL93DRAFT_2081215 [Clavulina sp. PMI_390]